MGWDLRSKDGGPRKETQRTEPRISQKCPKRFTSALTTFDLGSLMNLHHGCTFKKKKNNLKTSCCLLLESQLGVRCGTWGSSVDSGGQISLGLSPGLCFLQVVSP